MTARDNPDAALRPPEGLTHVGDGRLAPVFAGPGAVRLELWLTLADAELAGEQLARRASAVAVLLEESGEPLADVTRERLTRTLGACTAAAQQLTARAREARG